MKICFLTGFSGTLGKKVYKDLIKNDYLVVCVGRNNVFNCEYFIACDFMNFNVENFRGCVDKILKGVKNIEKLNIIHCAGFYEKETEDFIENNRILNKSFLINAFSFYNIVNVLLSYWKYYKVGGSCVAISSNLTKRRNKLTAPYISSKMALEGMVLSFAQSYGYLNVRFNSINPGMFESKINNFTVPKEFKENSPLKRICDLESLSNMILFLIGDKSNCVTAQNIVVDGGNSNGY